MWPNYKAKITQIVGDKDWLIGELGRPYYNQVKERLREGANGEGVIVRWISEETEPKYKSELTIRVHTQAGQRLEIEGMEVKRVVIARIERAEVEAIEAEIERYDGWAQVTEPWQRRDPDDPDYIWDENYENIKAQWRKELERVQKLNEISLEKIEEAPELVSQVGTNLNTPLLRVIRGQELEVPTVQLQPAAAATPGESSIVQIVKDIMFTVNGEEIEWISNAMQILSP